MSWRDPDNFFWNNESDLLRGLFNYTNAVSLQDLPWTRLKGDIKIHHPVLE
jgi:mannan endo-1,4-beta-mannosidase